MPGVPTFKQWAEWFWQAEPLNAHCICTMLIESLLIESLALSVLHVGHLIIFDKPSLVSTIGGLRSQQHSVQGQHVSGTSFLKAERMS